MKFKFLRPNQPGKRIFPLFGVVVFLSALSAGAQTNWSATPVSGDWNTASNWDSGVPDSNSAFATLGATNTASVTLSSDVDLDTLVFKAGAPTYTINTVNSLFLHGAGLTNNSGTAQNFNNSLFLIFEGNSGAANVSIANNWGLYFYDDSTAANSNIVNEYSFGFTDNASAGNSTILNNDSMFFNDSSKGGSADITNNDILSFSGTASAENADIVNGASVTTITGAIIMGVSLGDAPTLGNAGVLNWDVLDFYYGAKAGSASVTNNGNMDFHHNSTAENAVITNNGLMAFNDNSSVGNATVILNDSTAVYLYGSSTGGTSRFVFDTGGLVDMSTRTGGVTIGSMEGNGGFYLGGNNLGVGTNNLSTTLTGTLSDGSFSASLMKLGTGTFTVTGNNTYDGGTSIVAGAIRVNGTGTLGSGAVTNQAVLDISGHTGSLALGGLAGSGSVSLGSNNLTVGDDNLSTVFQGVISDGGYAGGTGGSLTKVGSTTFALTGLNTFTGGATLSEGTLLLGSGNVLGTSSLTVNGGLLGSYGAPLTMSLGGDYTQTANGAWLLYFLGTSAGEWDRMEVSGEANLGGSLGFFSTVFFQPNLGDTFTILEAGGVNGRFDSIPNVSVDIRLYPIYTLTGVQLMAIQPSFAALGSSSNQMAVGTWLDNELLDARLDSFIQTEGVESDPAVLRTDYDLLAPEELAPLFQMGYSTARGHAAVIVHRLSGLRDGLNPGSGSSRSREGVRLAADLPIEKIWDLAAVTPEKPKSEERWGVFLNGDGDFGSIGSDSNAAGYQFTVKGMTAGLDYRFSKELMGGLLLAYDETSTTGSGGGMVEMSGGQAGLYGGLRAEGFHLETLLEMGLHSYKTNRLGYGGAAPGYTQGQQFSGYLGMGYDWKMGQAVVGPYAAGQWSSVQIDSFSEQGSIEPLYYPAQSQSALQSEVGIAFGADLKVGAVTLVPSLRGGWGHDFEGATDSLIASLGEGSGTFTVQGPATGSESVVVGAGIDVQFARGLSAHVQYQGKLAKQNYDSQGFFGGFKAGF